jgi:peroxiredoxin-like protein
MDQHAYNVSLSWKEGRLGELSSPELDAKLEVATPPNFNKGVERIWSPEHLYTAAASSCLMTTFLAIAENSKLDFISLEIDAKGMLDKVEGKFLMTEIDLLPRLVIRDEKDREKAERILQKSEQACLISNSMTAKVKLHPTIRVEELAFSKN